MYPDGEKTVTVALRETTSYHGSIAVIIILGRLLRLLFRLSALAFRLLLGGLAVVLLALLVLAVVGILGLLGCLGDDRGWGDGFGQLRRRRLRRPGRGALAALSVIVGVRVRPLGGRRLVGPTVLVKLAVSLELLLLGSRGAETPSAGVEVALHDAALDLGDDTMVAGSHFNGRHHRDADGDRLALCSDQDALLVLLDIGLVPQQTRQHQLGTIGYGIHSTVLDDEPLVANEQGLQRLNNLS